MSKINHFKCYKTSPEIIKLAIMYYVRYPLSLRQVEDILHERGIDICHETVRYWWHKLGSVLSKEIKRSDVQHQFDRDPSMEIFDVERNIIFLGKGKSRY